MSFVNAKLADKYNEYQLTKDCYPQGDINKDGAEDILDVILLVNIN